MNDPNKTLLNTIFIGEVASVQNYGAFVSIPSSSNQGLVHRTQISKVNVPDASEVLARGDKIWCKVISISEDGKIALSMKFVDQGSGKDLDPNGVQLKQDEQRRKEWVPKNKRETITLDAVFNTTCSKCGTRGHLGKDCFQIAGGKTYELLPEEDDDNHLNADSVSPKHESLETNKHRQEKKKAKKKEKKERKLMKRKKKEMKKALKRKRKDSSSSSSSEGSHTSKQTSNFLKDELNEKPSVCGSSKNKVQSSNSKDLECSTSSKSRRQRSTSRSPRRRPTSRSPRRSTSRSRSQNTFSKMQERTSKSSSLRKGYSYNKSRQTRSRSRSRSPHRRQSHH